MVLITELSRKEIVEILLIYDKQLINFFHLDMGSTNTNYLIECPEEKLVLSVCDEKSVEGVTDLVELLLTLEQERFPTTRLVQSALGEYYTEHKGKPVLLKRFIEGKVPGEMTNAMYFRLGQTIAGLHEIEFVGKISQTFSYGLESFSKVTESLKQNDYTRWLSEQTDYLSSDINPDLPRGLVHGDVFYDNTLFRGEELVAIIDFEEAGNYFKIYDVGMCIVGTCAKDGKIDLRKARQLVNGYQSVRQLEDLEREQLQLFTSYGGTTASFWRYLQYNLRNLDDSKRDYYKEMVAITSHAGSISHREFIDNVF